mgnify:CR=1 FL=1
MIFPAHKTVLTLRYLFPDALLKFAASTEASSHVQSDLIEIMDFSAVVLKLGGRHENRSQDINDSSAEGGWLACETSETGQRW